MGLGERPRGLGGRCAAVVTLGSQEEGLPGVQGLAEEAEDRPGLHVTQIALDARPPPGPCGAQGLEVPRRDRLEDHHPLHHRRGDVPGVDGPGPVPGHAHRGPIGPRGVDDQAVRGRDLDPILAIHQPDGHHGLPVPGEEEPVGEEERRLVPAGHLVLGRRRDGSCGTGQHRT